jgi:ribonuclease R
MYSALTTARIARGAIAFETQESVFIFNENKKIDSVVPLIRNQAHKIIEECMILANVATAKFIEKHQKPGLFRVHDKPSEDKYRNFITYLNELGLSLAAKESPEPKDYGDILAKVAGRPDQELIQTMLLRSMRQAVYQSDNEGHFGLALPSYSHFTSPIRRYPDLVVHRVIKAILEKSPPSEANLGSHEYSLEAVIALGEHCSMTERRADEATRDVADWLKCEFMQDHVGDCFMGVISTVTNFGMFVRLQDLHIEGLVHITSLGRDFYHFDDVRMCLTGENTGKKFAVGDEVRVQVAAVNLDEKKIDLRLQGSDLDMSYSTHKKTKPRSKSKSRSTFSSNKLSSASTDSTAATKKNTSKRKIKAQPNDEFKASAKNKPKEKSKAKKRSTRKKRPGKNARKAAKK